MPIFLKPLSGAQQTRPTSCMWFQETLMYSKRDWITVFIRTLMHLPCDNSWDSSLCFLLHFVKVASSREMAATSAKTITTSTTAAAVMALLLLLLGVELTLGTVTLLSLSPDVTGGGEDGTVTDADSTISSAVPFHSSMRSGEPVLMLQLNCDELNSSTTLVNRTSYR